MWPLVVSFLCLIFRLDVVSSTVLEDGAQSLSACPDTFSALYDYIIIWVWSWWWTCSRKAG
jgi:hypothetical protein